MSLWTTYQPDRSKSSRHSPAHLHPSSFQHIYNQINHAGQSVNRLFNKRFGVSGALFLLSALALAAGTAALSDGGQPLIDSNKSNTPLIIPNADSQDSQSTNALKSNSAIKNNASGLSTSISSQNINGESSTSVTINGQSVKVPENGSTTQIVNTDDGQAMVTINNSQSNSGSSSSQTSVNSSLNTSSVNSQVNINQDYRSGQ